MLVSYCYNIKDKFCLKISDSYFSTNKSYGCVKNGMLYSDNAKIQTCDFYDPLKLTCNLEFDSISLALFKKNKSRLFLRLFEFIVSTLG